MENRRPDAAGCSQRAALQSRAYPQQSVRPVRLVAVEEEWPLPGDRSNTHPVAVIRCQPIGNWLQACSCSISASGNQVFRDRGAQQRKTALPRRT
jgi:hypothetical protein